jgi:hypothetical protein
MLCAPAQLWIQNTQAEKVGCARLRLDGGLAAAMRIESIATSEAL